VKPEVQLGDIDIDGGTLNAKNNIIMLLSKKFFLHSGSVKKEGEKHVTKA